MRSNETNFPEKAWLLAHNKTIVRHKYWREHLFFGPPSKIIGPPFFPSKNLRLCQPTLVLLSRSALLNKLLIENNSGIMKKLRQTGSGLVTRMITSRGYAAYYNKTTHKNGHLFSGDVVMLAILQLRLDPGSCKPEMDTDPE